MGCRLGGEGHGKQSSVERNRAQNFADVVGNLQSDDRVKWGIAHGTQLRLALCNPIQTCNYEIQKANTNGSLERIVMIAFGLANGTRERWSRIKRRVHKQLGDCYLGS